MAKIAKLVKISLITRVIVEDTATEAEIMIEALPRLGCKLTEDGIFDNIEEIVDDTECPIQDDEK